MSIKNIRLASTLTFDEQQEADIINIIEAFSASHKMGAFLSCLLRVAFENPEVVVCKDGKYEPGVLVETIERLGKSPTRHNYMNEINKKVLDMQVKVDKMYEMCLRIYTMVEMGKRLGIEKKAENAMLAQFTIEQQLGQLKKTLGVDCQTLPFASNKLEGADKRANEILDYIISCYEPIINELKKEISVSTKEVEVPIVKFKEIAVEKTLITQNTEVKQEQNVNNQALNNNIHKEGTVQNVIQDNDKNNKEENVEDFNSTADFSALADFFND